MVNRMGNLHPSARFISFEGIDGCGKSTLMAQLTRWLERAEIPHITTREPGGTPLGESIRTLLLDPAYKAMDQRAEVLLYTASRAQLVHDVIYPAIREGTWVLTDRYIDATLAYQGYGRGLDLERLRQIQDWAVSGILPDSTILLDCDVEVAWRRMECRQETLDRMEQEDRAFHERVREGYLRLADSEPDRFLVLDAAKPLEQVIADFEARFWQPDIAGYAPVSLHPREE